MTFYVGFDDGEIFFPNQLGFERQGEKNIFQKFNFLVEKNEK